MRRATTTSVLKRDEPLLKRILQLKAEHPYWGYRRMWAQLRFVDHLLVNEKRIYRIMRQHGLLVQSNPLLKASRTPQRSKPHPDRPNQWWGIDMSKVLVEGFGWMYIVIVLDWYSKKIVGYYEGFQCTVKHWEEALNMAVQKQFPEGVRGEGLQLMSDNGCQPTSVGFMRSCAALQIQQAFTSYNNPKGNADTERMFRTMKEELLWLRDWQSPFELSEALGKWIEQYNREYLHSALGYKPPCQAEREYFERQKTLTTVA